MISLFDAIISPSVRTAPIRTRRLRHGSQITFPAPPKTGSGRARTVRLSLSLTLTFKISGIMLNTDPEEDSVLCLALRYLCKSLSTPFLAPPVPHSPLGGLSSIFSILSSLVRWSCPSQTLVALTI